jgi:TetR/AcrR family tetracycline transcriptional repressor
VIDAEGLPALNMRRLGSELGVDAMAVYRHLPNKQAILDGVVDLVLADLAEGPPAGPRVQAREFFTSLRHVLAAHPNAIPLVASSALQTGAAKEKATRLLAALRRSGIGVELALDVFHALESFALGYAWLELAGFVGELPESAPFVRRNVPTGARTGAASAEQAERDGRYERCLDAILEALLPA